jgi:prepilin-type N-terminal cleavage/methylation domain-containing protein
MLRSKNLSSGFSLLELLVVMAVMGIMIGLIGFSFIGSGGGQIGQGQRLLLSLLQQARTLAVSSGNEVRLIVSADSTDEEKYLRYMEIVLAGDNNDTNDISKSWAVQGSGIYLPNQVWFVSNELENMPEEWPSDGQCLWSNSGDTPFKLSYPVAGKRSEQGQDLKSFHYISSNAGGVFQNSTSLKLVLSSGNLRQVGGELKPYFPNPKILLGVLIQPFGGMFALGSEDFTHEN